MLKWHIHATRMKPRVVEIYREWNKCFCGHRILNNVVIKFDDYDSENEANLPPITTVGVDCASTVLDHALFKLLTSKVYLSFLDDYGKYNLENDGELKILKSLIKAKKEKDSFLKFVEFMSLDDTLKACYPDVYENMTNMYIISCTARDTLLSDMQLIKRYFKSRANALYGKRCEYHWNELELKLMKLPENELMVGYSTKWVHSQSGTKTYKNALGIQIKLSILKDWWFRLYYGHRLSDKQLKILKRSI